MQLNNQLAVLGHCLYLWVLSTYNECYDQMIHIHNVNFISLVVTEV